MKSNSRGFSTMEVLMSLAMISAIGAAAMSAADYFARATVRMESRLGQVRLLNDLRTSLMNRDTCMNTLVNKQFQAGVNSPISLRLDAASFDPSRPTTFDPSKVVSSSGPQSQRNEYKIAIRRLELANKQLMFTYPTGDTLHRTQVLLEASELGGSNQFLSGGPVGTLLFRVNPAGDIIDCMIGETPLDGRSLTCQALGGTLVGDACQLPSDRVEVVCPNGQYLAGFTNTGGKDCRNLPTPPTVPSPPVPVCTEESRPQGPGQGASGRVFQGSYACQASCLGTYGPGSSCVGGCTVGYRLWNYCGNCEKKVWVCR